MIDNDCSISVEDRFGPVVEGCGDNFDFTLLFEETVLYIGPLCLCLVLAALRCLWLFRQKSVARRGWLYVVKMGLYASLFITSVVLLALTARTHTPRTRATLAAISLGLIGSILIALLSAIEHRRTARPSTLLVLYHLGSLPLNIVRTRTWWRIPGGRGSAIAFLIYTILGGILLIGEMLRKSSALLPGDRLRTKEEMYSIVDRSFMSWLSPMYVRGYRKPLVFSDMIPIDAELCGNKFGVIEPAHAKAVNETDSTSWTAAEKRSTYATETKSKPSAKSSSLFRRTVRAYWIELVTPIIPKALYIALNFSQAFLLQRVTTYISRPVDANTYKYGGGLILAYFLVYVGIATTNVISQQAINRAVTTIRSGLLTQIFGHALSLDMSNEIAGKGTTLIVANVERVEVGLRRMHDVWSSLITTGIGLWLVGVQLGVAILPAVGVLLLAMVANFYLSKLGIPRQKRWLDQTAVRVNKTNQMLKSIKEMRVAGYGRHIREKLQASRATEIDYSQSFRALLVGRVVLSNVALVLTPALALGVHAVLDRNHGGLLLNASQAFSSLALLSIVSSALANGLLSVFAFIVGIGSLQDIGSFLDKRAHVDSRKAVPQNDDLKTYLSEKVRSDQSSSRTSASRGSTSPRCVIQVDDLHAKWEEQATWAVRDIDLRIQRGTVNIITGPTGAGKSTLLKAILGELLHVSGSVAVAQRHMGYCDQSPWLGRATIRDTITGVSAFDEGRYRATLNICALDHDLSEMEEGDNSLCGSNGLKLSGGQKTRIALARTIYANERIMLLDEPFHGLDATTEQSVLQALFAPDGYLRRHGTTVIVALTTPRSEILNWADQLITLDQTGQLVDAAKIEKGEGILHDESIPQHDTADDENQSKNAQAQIQERKTTDSDEEVGRKQKSEWSAYNAFSKATGRVNLVLFTVFCILFVVGSNYPQIYLRSWVEKSRTEQQNTLGTLLGVYFGVGSAAGVAYAAAAMFFMFAISPRLSTAFHDKVLDTVLNAPLSILTGSDHGQLINRFSQDMSLVDRDIPFTFIGTAVALLQLLAQLIVVIVGSNYAGIAIPGVLLTVWVIQHVYLRTSRRLRLLDIEAKSPLLTQLMESMAGLLTIRACGWTVEYVRRGVAALQRAQKPFYLLYSGQVMLTLSLDLVSAALAIIVVSIAVGTRTAGSGDLGLALFNIVNLGGTIKDLITAWTTLEVSLGAITRVVSFVEDTPSERRDDDQTPPDNWPQRGEINIENIVVSYSDDASLPPVLDGLSLHIPAGSKVGICGRTGSGKSTLINSLLRIVDPRAGRILVDGVDLSRLDRDALRARFVVQSQESLILPATLRENLTWRRGSSNNKSNNNNNNNNNGGMGNGSLRDEELITALKDAQLWDEVFAPRQGLDTVLGDDALSLGERQALALAALALQESRVVVLDEPTSTVDEAIQSRFRAFVTERLGGRTVICVAHRLETIRNFDLVGVMQSGKLVEFGPPGELLARAEGSLFAQLYHQQGVSGG